EQPLVGSALAPGHVDDLGSAGHPDPHADREHARLLVDPADEFRVLRAPDLRQGAVDLLTDAATRWQIDSRVAPRDPAFVRGERLIAGVEAFVARPGAGYLVLVGGMGVGKTALLTELLHRRALIGDPPIYHLVGREGSASADPEAVARCLYGRLRRKYRFAEP